MNFLELCKAVRRECLIPGDGPSTVVGQSGQLGDIVSATRSAWDDIQAMHQDWLFLKDVVSAGLTVDKDIYTPADLGMDDMARVRRIKVQGSPIDEVEFDFFIDVYGHRGHESGAPYCYTITPQSSVQFFPTPNKPLPVQCMYVKSPQTLAANEDAPIVPAHYHNAIVWQAVMNFTVNESDGPLYQKAAEKFDIAISNMLSDFLPSIRLGDSRFA